MKLHPRTLLLSVTAALIVLAGSTQAQTVISGPNIMTTTWSPVGNPYILTADCTVPTGQTLTILPGTVVWMGSGTSLTGDGIIYAVGTAAQPITFAPPVLSQMWNTIIIKNSVGTNQFKYCDFMNATNALDFRGASRNEVVDCLFSNTANGIVYRDNSVNLTRSCSFQNLGSGVWMTVGANNWVQTNSILGCSFSNCVSAIYGEAVGTAGRTCGANSCYNWSQNAQLVSEVRNCLLVGVDYGCRFNLAGYGFTIPQQGGATGYGYGQVKLLNNVFWNVTNTAVWFSVGSFPGGGSTSLLNNDLVDAGNGMVIQDPWNATIQNNILKGCANGITRFGSLSTVVSYNALSSNTTNFVGYPATYGQAILANRNGTPCDVLFNIFSDPMFVSSSDFHLQAGSSCIDAGEGSGANFDSYFPPSMGSLTNDIGAYGGPGAGQWIAPPPTNPFTLGISKFTMASVTINPPEPGHYRLEYSSALLGTNTWIQITNLPLTTLPFTYTEPVTVPARYFRAVKQ